MADARKMIVIYGGMEVMQKKTFHRIIPQVINEIRGSHGMHTDTCSTISRLRPLFINAQNRPRSLHARNQNTSKSVTPTAVAKRLF